MCAYLYNIGTYTSDLSTNEFKYVIFYKIKQRHMYIEYIRIYIFVYN